jgi:hypothetical protein
MLWATYGKWAVYGVLLALVALVGPTFLAHKGGRAFTVCVALVWLVATLLMHPVGFSAAFWVSHLGEASAGFASTAIGYGVPVWGTAISILTLKRSGASLLVQRLGSLAVGALLCPLATSVAFFVALFLIEGVLGAH